MAKPPEKPKVAYDPDDPFGDILPKSKKPPAAAAAPKPSLNLDRSKFAAAEENDADTPPELPSKPAPRQDNGSGQALDETIQKLPREPEKTRGAPIASILIIFAMLAILGGAGYGVWWIFTDSSEPESSESGAEKVEPSVADKGETEAKGPIEKARAVVSDISTGDLDAITGAETVERAPAPVPANDAPVDKTFEIVETPEPRPANTPSSKPTEDVGAGPVSTALRAEVSAFLSKAEIGAVRTGEKARVMLNGTSYNIGDLVDQKSGLLFAGTRDGRLVFRDRNGVYYVKSF